MKLAFCSQFLSLCLVAGKYNCLGEQVEEVDDKLNAVDEKLNAVDEKLKAVDEKLQLILDQLSCCCQNDTSTPTTAQEFLYISESRIYELPSFLPATSCPVPPLGVGGPGLRNVVAGLSDGSLVICGGPCHTLTENGWVEMASLQEEVREAAASQTPKGLVVTGGGGAGFRNFLSTTQTLSGGKWTTGPEIPVKILGHCQVTVGSAIQIVGGLLENLQSSSDSYTLGGGIWSKLRSMKTARSRLACAFYKDEVYAIGGEGTDTVEIFNMNTFTWRYGPPITGSTAWGQAVVFRDVLYYIGTDGQVIKLGSDGNGWEKVTNIGSIGSHRDGYKSVFSAPIVTRHNIKC